MIGENVTKYSRVDALAGLEMLSGRYKRHRFVPHFHETYAIGVCEQGGLAFKTPGRRHLAERNQVMILHPGEVHQGEAADSSGWTYRMIYPSSEVISDLLDDHQIDPACPPGFSLSVVSDQRLARSFVSAHRAAERGASAIETQSRFCMALSALFVKHGMVRQTATCSTSGRMDDRIRRAIEFIHAHYNQDIQLSQVAEVANISSYYLIKQFKHVTGLAPHAYLTHQRVQEARRLLKSDMPISEIAVGVGFYDQSHFSNRFRAVFGYTPKQYRSQIKGASRRTARS